MEPEDRERLRNAGKRVWSSDEIWALPEKYAEQLDNDAEMRRACLEDAVRQNYGKGAVYDMYEQDPNEE